MKRTNLICFVILIFLADCNNEQEFPEFKGKPVDGKYLIKKGEIRNEEITYKADFGTIALPENRSKSDSRIISIPFVRVRSLNNNSKEPVFVLGGGPGQSNLNWSLIDEFLKEHDFVMVGYRGADGSAVLDFPEISEAIKSLEGDILNTSNLKKIGNVWKDILIKMKKSGIDIQGYTITETIADIDKIREILNYRKINLLSESYGTRVAYLYGLIKPEVINRSIMIGVNPPGNFLWDENITDSLLYRYSELWGRDKKNILITNNLAETVKRVFNNMPSKWLFFEINPGKVKTAIFCMLFNRNSAAMVFDAIVAADKGDYSGIALISGAFNKIIPDMFIWGDLSAKAMSADYKYLDSLKTGSNNKTILGNPLTDFLWKPLVYGNFMSAPLPDSLCIPAKTDVETLMLSGSLDFSTPPQKARDFLQYFSRGRQIIISECGHVADIKTIDPAYINNLMTEFYNTGKVGEVKNYYPMDFKVSFGFPLIMKTGVYGIPILIIVILLTAYWYFFKYRKRKKNDMVNEDKY